MHFKKSILIVVLSLFFHAANFFPIHIVKLWVLTAHTHPALPATFRADTIAIRALFYVGGYMPTNTTSTLHVIHLYPFYEIAPSAESSVHPIGSLRNWSMDVRDSHASLEVSYDL